MRKWVFSVAVLLVVFTGWVLYAQFLCRPTITLPDKFDTEKYRKLPYSEQCLHARFDFETDFSVPIKSISIEGREKPTRVFVFNDSLEFGPTYSTKIKTICESARLGKLVFTCDAFASRKDLPAPVVVSIELDGKSLYWNSVNIPFAHAEWKNVKIEFDLPSNAMEPEAEIKIYVWNNSRNSFMIDNMTFDFLSIGGEKQTYGYYPERFVSLDFENQNDNSSSNVRLGGAAFSGIGSCKLDLLNPFSPVVTRRVGQISDGSLIYIMTRAEIKPAFDNPFLCFAVSLADSSGKEYHFQTRSNERYHPAGEWTSLKAKLDLPYDRIQSNDIISVYVWNRGLQDVYIDNFEVQFAESNKRVGQKPFIDMNGYGDNGYDYKKNIPPFRKKTLSTIDIDFSAASTRYNAKHFIQKPLNAFDKVFAGRFGAAGYGTSQIAVVREQALFVFGFCSKKSEWTQMAFMDASNGMGFDFDKAGFFVLDIDGDGFDELLCHKTGEKDIRVLRPERVKQKEPCYLGPPMSILLDHLPCDVALSKSNFKYMAYEDFIGDTKPEMLFIDMLSGNFLFLDDSGKLIKKGSDDELKFKSADEVVIKAVPFESLSRKQHIAVRKNEQSEFQYYLFNEKESGFTKQDISGAELASFIGCDDILVDAATDPKLFLFHRTIPKFGLFTVSFESESGLVIQNEFDFTGYVGQRNPKYYEKRILFSGDFSGLGKKELLVIASNCGDANYLGNRCDVPEVSAPFPPISYIIKID